MWPINVIRKRSRDRRFKAALVVLLGQYTVDRLPPEQRARVEAEMDADFNRTDTPAVAARRCLGWADLAASRATAMERAGIEPVVAGLSWSELLRPWRFSRNVPAIVPFTPQWYGRAGALMNDFHVMGAATIGAKQFLRANGIDVPDADPSPTR